MKILMSFILLQISAALWLPESCFAESQKKTLRMGYFANITHAQALIGVQESRFEKALNPVAKFESVVFNAGPSAVEALLADSVDVIYVGPNPAINAWVKARASVNVVSGSCSGGARLIVRKDVNLTSPKDFAGKKIATQQLGNTQDVAARTWLAEQGLKSKDKGGTVDVLPIKNADQLSLFLRKEIDAAWAVEPWASRLVTEANGREYLDERKLWPQGNFTTTVILTTKKFIKENPELLRVLLAEHVEITNWIKNNPAEAKKIINLSLKKLTSAELSPSVLESSFSALEFTLDPHLTTMKKSAEAAFALGFLGKTKPDLKNLTDLSVLNDVLIKKKIKPILVDNEK